jgi:uncharacterized protein YukE
MSRIRLVLVAVPTALLLAACSSPHNSATTTATTPAVSAPTTSAPAQAAAATSSATAASAAGLSGSWSGQYGGAYQGTFSLSWHQSGSNLSGTIKISAPPDSLPIHGTVKNGGIRFGTVGSLAITYSGSVSGNSMSGTYQVHAPDGAAGGPWSASKAS